MTEGHLDLETRRCSTNGCDVKIPIKALNLYCFSCSDKNKPKETKEEFEARYEGNKPSLIELNKEREKWVIEHGGAVMPNPFPRSALTLQECKRRGIDTYPMPEGELYPLKKIALEAGSLNVINKETGEQYAGPCNEAPEWALPKPEEDLTHMSYYGDTLQPADLIRSLGWMKQFAAGNVIKYVARCEKKGGLADLEKAKVYLGWLIDEVKK